MYLIYLIKIKLSILNLLPYFQIEIKEHSLMLLSTIISQRYFVRIYAALQLDDFSAWLTPTVFTNKIPIQRMILVQQMLILKTMKHQTKGMCNLRKWGARHISRERTVGLNATIQVAQVHAGAFLIAHSISGMTNGTGFQ